jgi:SAM-dependent methyltransferase
MDASDSSALSDHLLRTLAAVPVSSQILDFGCGDGRHTEALLRLGFPLHACDPRPDAVTQTRDRIRELLEEGDLDTIVQETPLDAIEYPDDTFDWIVADRAETYVTNKVDLKTFFEESRRLLKPGGWLYLTLPATPEASVNGTGFTIEIVESFRRDAELVEASEATRIEEEGEAPRLRAIYRCVDPQTPA